MSSARIGPFDQGGMVRRGRAPKADAEEAIYDQRRSHRRRLSRRRAAGANKCSVRSCGIGGQLFRVASKHDDDIVKRRTKPTRDDERVTAVVPRSREHNHGAAAITEHRACDFGGRRPCTLHQRRVTVARFERAQLRYPENGLKLG